MSAKRRGLWGRDRDTGARGLDIGHRRVKNGKVKIAGKFWEAVPGRGSLESYEGKYIEVNCSDPWATRYDARDADTLNFVAYLRVVNVEKNP